MREKKPLPRAALPGGEAKGGFRITRFHYLFRPFSLSLPQKPESPAANPENMQHFSPFHAALFRKSPCAFLLLLCITLCAPRLAAQDVGGTWGGRLQVGPAGLRLTVHLVQAGDSLRATLDSPDQGAYGLKVAAASMADSVLSLQMPALGASFRGRLRPGGEIEGTFSQGADLPLTLRREENPGNLRPQEPQPPFPYRSEEVRVRNAAAGISLSGTLTLPPDSSARYPAVVLLTGSGPQNRDSELFGHKPFLLLADHLTRRGIAVLRCDDRGTGRSEGDFPAAADPDFASDAAACLRYLQGRPEIDPARVGLLGHSAGATAAFLCAADCTDVCFIVSLAGAALPGDSILLSQNRALLRLSGQEGLWPQQYPQLRTLYDLLRRDLPAAARTDSVYRFFLRALPPEQRADSLVRRRLHEQARAGASPWMTHFLRHDPAEALRRVRCPILALGGSRDIQVEAAPNLAALAAAAESGGNRRVETRIYEGLNHLFQPCSTGAVGEYGQIRQTMDEQVLEDIAAWILAVTRR